jgi:hypothetical protein
VVDAADPVALGRWWRGALGRFVVNADVGQGEQSWQVPTDIEGDEFCVLSPRRT